MITAAGDDTRCQDGTMFTSAEYEQMHSLVFKPGYPGYKPEVKEILNGDGKVDRKRYAHIAPKYLTPEVPDEDRVVLEGFLRRAHYFAETAARLAEIPLEFMPDIRYGALRVLEYGPGDFSNLHQDFDLFTLMCYRDQPDRFVARSKSWSTLESGDAIRIIREINSQAHLGELGEAIGLGSATPHEVLPSETSQHSIVLFAIPDHNAVLPSGETVRDFLNQRMLRSRTSFSQYG